MFNLIILQLSEDVSTLMHSVSKWRRDSLSTESPSPMKPHSSFPRTARGIFDKWNPSSHLPLLEITENKLQRLCIHKAKAQRIWSCHLSSLFFVYLVYKISSFPQHISHAPASVFLQWSSLQLLSIYLWIPLSYSQPPFHHSLLYPTFFSFIAPLTTWYIITIWGLILISLVYIFIVF